MPHLTIAHSPDSDDAFMFYALAADKIPTGDLTVSHELHDIETLNQAAAEERYDITAFSFHAYAYLADRYQLLPCGASFGSGYGPKIVTKTPMTHDALHHAVIAIPGRLTTAALVLQLYLPGAHVVTRPFDQILDVVARGEVDAGVIIHEGQLTYGQQGLHQHIDLGAWWDGETGLPLPLGGNGIRRSLPLDLRRQAASLLRQSIDYALAHREEALAYAMQFGRGLETAQADRFVGMYVNGLTQEYGQSGRDALRVLFTRAQRAMIIPQPAPLDFVE